MLGSLLNASFGVLASMAVAFVIPLKMASGFCDAEANDWGRCFLSTLLAFFLAVLVLSIPGLGINGVLIAGVVVFATHMAVLKVPRSNGFGFLVVGLLLHLATWFAVYSGMRAVVRHQVETVAEAQTQAGEHR